MRKGRLFGKPIRQVIKRPGAFRRAAQRRGMSTRAFALRVMRAPKGKYPPRLRRQASLALTLMRMRRKR